MPAAIAIPLAFAFGGASIAQSERQRRQQGRALRAQEQAQREATSRAAAERRRQETEQRRLRRRKPNVASLLGEEQRLSQRGAGATLLTGVTGINRQRATLGHSSLLGVA